MSVTPSPTRSPTPTPTITPTPSYRCNYNNIGINIPANMINNKFASVLFRVGGENCCYPLSPNSFSNVVGERIPRLPLPSQPPPPGPTPTPTPSPSASALPCIPSAPNLDGYKIQVDYSKSCRVYHRCDAALFILYINSIRVGSVDLNNLSDGGERFNTLNIPPGINAINNMYEIKLIPAIGRAHSGIAKITIKNASNEIVFSQCLPDDTASFIPVCS